MAVCCILEFKIMFTVPVQVQNLLSIVSCRAPIALCIEKVEKKSFRTDGAIAAFARVARRIQNAPWHYDRREWRYARQIRSQRIVDHRTDVKSGRVGRTDISRCSITKTVKGSGPVGTGGSWPRI